MEQVNKRKMRLRRPLGTRECKFGITNFLGFISFVRIILTFLFSHIIRRIKFSNEQTIDLTCVQINVVLSVRLYPKERFLIEM